MLNSFDILLAKRRFCLHLHFGAARENRLKSLRWHFPAPRGFYSLRALAVDTERVANLQNEAEMLFCHVEMTKQPAFSPNLARSDSESLQAENQTPHAEMPDTARCVRSRSTRQCSSLHAATAFPARFTKFSATPKTDRLKAKTPILRQDELLPIWQHG